MTGLRSRAPIPDASAMASLRRRAKALTTHTAEEYDRQSGGAISKEIIAGARFMESAARFLRKASVAMDRLGNLTTAVYFVERAREVERAARTLRAAVQKEAGR